MRSAVGGTKVLRMPRSGHQAEGLLRIEFLELAGDDRHAEMQGRQHAR